MSRLDEELEKVAAEPVAIARRPRPVQQPKPNRSIGLLVALMIVAVVIGVLVVMSFRNAAVYAKTVDQLLAAQSSLKGRTVRVEGVLVHGTLQRRDQPCEYRFQIAKNSAVLEVRYPQCVVPDTFRDRSDTEVAVTAQGTLHPDGYFEATEIMAKCPSKYEEKDGKKVPVGYQPPSR